MNEQKAQPAQAQQSQTTVQVSKGRPYLVKGKFAFVGTDGKEETKEGSIALCRCGGLNNKPFCDGTHRKIGFTRNELNISRHAELVSASDLLHV